LCGLHERCGCDAGEGSLSLLEKLYLGVARTLRFIGLSKWNHSPGCGGRAHLEGEKGGSLGSLTFA